MRRQRTRRRRAPGVGIAGLALVALAAFTPYRFQEIYHGNAAAVVRIQVTTPRSERFASAFLVHADGTMVAPAESLRDAQGVHIVDTQGRTLPVEILAVEPALGVAVLRAPSSGELPTVKIGSAARVRHGDWVVGISHGDGNEAEAVAGCVSRIGRSEAGREFVIDAATAPGGPVLNLDGEVVAIAVRRQGARRAVAVGIDQVRTLLVRVREQERAARPPSPTAVGKGPT